MNLHLRWRLAIYAEAIVGLIVGGPKYMRYKNAMAEAALQALHEQKFRQVLGLPLSDWAEDLWKASQK